MSDSSVTRWVGVGAVILLALAAWFAWGSPGVEVAPAPNAASETATTLRQETEAKPKRAEARVEVKDTTVASDATAAPAVGEVVVTLRWADDDAPVVGHEVIVTDQWTGTTPRRLDGAHTGADGIATLSLAPGAHLLMALSQIGQRVRVAAGARVEVSIRLPRAGIIVGRVVDVNDAPIAAAEVLAVRGDLAGGPSRLATSGADGSFRVTVTNPMSFLFARKRGHGASAAVQVRTTANAETMVDLVVAAATTSLRGRVVDEANQPIEGARVVLGAATPPAKDNLYVEPGVRPRTVTAADGTFAFDDVSPGRGGCFASASGRQSGGGEFEAQIGSVAEVRIVLGQGARVRGQVFDAEGRPAAGVVVSRGKYPDSRDPTTGADGRFTFDVFPGSWEVVARSRALGVAVVNVEVAARETREVELHLRAEPILEGRVVDERGAPLAGLWVVAWPKDGVSWQPFPSDATDDEGRFRLVGCAGGPLDVKVRAGQIMSGPILARADGVTAGGTSLTLVVHDAARPSAFLTLRVDDPRHPDWPCQLLVQDVETGDEESVIVAKGRAARLGPLAAGSYRVRHFHKFDRSNPIFGLDLGPIALAAGEERDLGTHVLSPATSLHLTLTRSDGTAVRALNRLRLVPADGSPPIAAQLTMSGDVFPASFPPGRYRVEVEASMAHEAGSAEVDLLADATTPLTLELPALRPCEIRMRPPEGRHPPYRTRAQLRTEDGQSRDVEAWNGFLRLGLHPGTYTVNVDTDGCRGSTRFTVDSVGGGELRVDLPVQ